MVCVLKYYRRLWGTTKKQLSKEKHHEAKTTLYENATGSFEIRNSYYLNAIDFFIIALE